MQLFLPALPMTSPVTCRGLPLSGLLVADGSGSSEGSYYVSVHELSIQLWKNFDTPRVSVQKKFEDLGIPLTKCSKKQLGILRKKGVVAGFRATIVSIQDAEKVCDALQHSREKRGLAKHPLKAKGGSRERREEAWLTRMNARNARISCVSSGVKKGTENTSELVDGCALIGGNLTPTQIRGDRSKSQRQLASQLPCEKDTEQQRGTEHHEVVKYLDQFAALSRSQLRDLEALNLFSETMATLRSYLAGGGKGDVAAGSLQHSKEVSRSAMLPIRSRIIKLPTSTSCSPLKLKRPPRLHSAATPAIVPSKETNCINHIMSPTAGHHGCSPELTTRELHGLLSTEKADRFLYWSDDEEPDHATQQDSEDVIFVRVERNDGKDVAKSRENATLLKPRPKPHPKRVITTKLRHFAHTTSPAAAASSSPGKQLPLGSTHSRRGVGRRRKALWVHIPCSQLKNIPRTAPRRVGRPLAKRRHHSAQLGHLSSNLHNSVPEPSSSTTLHSNKKGPPLLINSRPKQTLSSFATMKRARALSPVEPLKPAKRQKLTAGRDTSLSTSLAKGAGTPVRTFSRPGRVSDGAAVQTCSEEAGSSVPKGTTPAVGGAKSGKPLPCSNEAGPSKDSTQHFVEGERTAPVTSCTVGTSGEPSSGNRRGGTGTDTKHRGAKVISEAEGQRTPPGTFKFEQLFGYYPPKLTLQDGDLCPQHSLSVSGMERSKLSSLPPTHPFLNWTLGQPISKAAGPSVKTSRRKQKSKNTNNVS